MRLQEVTVTELEGMVRAGQVAPLRVGVTNDPRRRAGEYKTEYSENATMYYAKTSNMRTMLKINYLPNVQREGRAPLMFNSNRTRLRLKATSTQFSLRFS